MINNIKNCTTCANINQSPKFCADCEDYSGYTPKTIIRDICKECGHNNTTDYVDCTFCNGGSHFIRNEKIVCKNCKHSEKSIYECKDCINYSDFKSKEDIKKYVVTHYYPELEDLKYKELVETYDFDVTSKGTAPVAIYAFLISNSFEDCLRTAISIGGDTDTLAAISMSIAEAYYYKKEDLQYYKKKVRRYLNNDLYTTFNSFTKRFIG